MRRAFGCDAHRHCVTALVCAAGILRSRRGGLLEHLSRASRGLLQDFSWTCRSLLYGFARKNCCPSVTPGPPSLAGTAVDESIVCSDPTEAEFEKLAGWYVPAIGAALAAGTPAAAADPADAGVLPSSGANCGVSACSPPVCDGAAPVTDASDVTVVICADGDGLMCTGLEAIGVWSATGAEATCDVSAPPLMARCCPG
jgi:hypothetical protein